MSAHPPTRPIGWTLAVDTSTVVAVGLAHDGTAVAAETVGDNHSHVELLVPTIGTVLARAGIGWDGLTRIGVGVGPGRTRGRWIRRGRLGRRTWLGGRISLR